MCGIVGIVATEDVAANLIDGLRRLEYRGYDSAGIAVMTKTGDILRSRAAGKLKNLEKKLLIEPLSGNSGIAHTRWATHGAPNENNAHPHEAGRVHVVHNGIIENFMDLRAGLEAAGRALYSETDTEVIAHLIDAALQEGHAPKIALEMTLKRLEGAFALAIMIHGEDDLLLGARRGGPLVAGLGPQAGYIASDPIALAPFTRDVIYLEEGDYCIVSKSGAQVFDETGSLADRPLHKTDLSTALAERGHYRHFMEKEIHEQAEVVGRTLSTYIDPLTMMPHKIKGVEFSQFDRLIIVACGTAAYAGRIAEYWFERYAGIPTEVDIASEFRYRGAALSGKELALFISQSGETADTLAALRWCKSQGIKTAVLVNTPHSTMAREADIVLPTRAGAEIGVASTKAFTCQLAALASLAVLAGVSRQLLNEETAPDLLRGLMEAPRHLNDALDSEPAIQRIAHEMMHAQTVLYLGRGVYYPLALEGALKLKEISYIHAEGYAAGELKHGPIALLDEGLPVVVIAPKDSLFEKTRSNVEEIVARGASVILISDVEGIARMGSIAAETILMPTTPEIAAPIVASAAIQLLAYHVATAKGTDVDQPRNLAKSVTVE
ncbi:glutamine--fructose-6-phosphate transaminase (isomerizing) [Hyphobacterium sp. CCMP332]|uniref:glutamine--fructose-6-phosphate transaminase (isomerizing) n=1 Tax=Hyphobacterium sp. CCMP332 TaxID=2749086 RepID=UPI00165043FA|nr:glutamine--fructose-6-phosphate transaminase (isomerizing) [Hyphobacterium sp. CCMP332]QNL17868.1 glutamine--fructose-6-phosphate transaminase (isomerizing) [Hyphobacterium sp. CCMP332]